jgi:hypothetical protein
MKTTTKMVSALLGAGVLSAALSREADAACNFVVGASSSTQGQWGSAYDECVDNSQGYNAEADIGATFGNSGPGWAEVAVLYDWVSGSTNYGYWYRVGVQCISSGWMWQQTWTGRETTNVNGVFFDCNQSDTAIGGAGQIWMPNS